MNRVKSACVATNSSKTCFISLSAELAEIVGLRIQGQPFAIQLQWAEGKAFTSWSGDVVHRRKDEYQSGTQSVVQLGNKFADSLGLKDGDQVIIEPVKSIPSCNRICVDPVSVNDWEILELHAGYVENQLLNQVRVVFHGQLLPIWIEKQTCVVVKIVAMEPEAFCLRLDEFTEVVVSPKTRNVATSNKDQQSSILETNIRSNAHNLSSEGLQNTQGNKGQIVDSSLNGVRRKSPSGGSLLSYDDTITEKDGANKAVETDFISRVTGYVRSLFVRTVDQDHAIDCGSNFNVTTSHTAQLEHTSVSGDISKTAASTICIERFTKTDIDLYLRVQPEMEVDVFNDCSSCETEVSEHSNMTYYSRQPSTVFVDFASLPRSILQEFSHHFSIFPPPNGTVVKNVLIKKISSPKERGSQINDMGNRKETTDTSQQKESRETGSVQSERMNPSNSCWIVRMVVMSCKASYSVDHCTSEMIGNKDVLPKHIALSQELRLVLGANDFSLVKLESISHSPSNVQGIILHPFGNTGQKISAVVSPDSAIEAFQEWLYSVCSYEVPLVICSGMLVSFHTSEGEHIQLIVSVLSHQPSPDVADSLRYYHLTPDTVQQITIVLGTHIEALQQLGQAVNSQEIHASRLKCAMKDLGGVTDNFEKCVHHALSSLGERKLIAHLGGSITTGLSSGALLICGSGSGAGIGCGKTSLAHAVCHKLLEWPVCAHVTVVECIPLRGKRVDVIQKNWQHVFAEAAWHQPSVILFDDLDQVVSVPSALQELGGEALYKRRLAKVFKELINTAIVNNSKVVVIATARSRDSLHPSLLTSRGCHIFQCCAELHPPDASQREEILCAIINKKMSQQAQEGLDLGSSSLMKKTEGFSPKDLCSLVDRALHVAASRKMQFLEENSVSSVLTAEDFKIALEGFTPAALRGVSLHTAGELCWSDVGGLLKVKDALVEMLLWPTKYSWLFNKCPLRIRSGLLLYGPPGTGKTLLAGVVAKECGLNFISIKGPELLSKYIGASEQAVRDVFTRAQSAKPCILFFDEFDSLAPRRGHDSTGVTDRVVNQLLTQLDGVEGLDGVYVLAATSCPDLIDPALLRPGRLDKCLYCGIPDKSERLEVLQALSRSLLLAEDTDLQVISNMCENFTGADFKALLYNAQLAAIHRCTSKHQLYKGIFENDEESNNKSKDTPLDKRNLVYISSLEEGSKEIPDDEFTRLQSKVAVITENLNHNVSSQKLSRSDSSGSQVTSGVKINQSDLLQAASSMGPSVSDSERLRYQTIYDTFINSRGGEFKHNTPGQGRATLA